jgi:outer membrane protein OmpA-like peptidoglycan-associated protein
VQELPHRGVESRRSLRRGRNPGTGGANTGTQNRSMVRHTVFASAVIDSGGKPVCRFLNQKEERNVHLDKWRTRGRSGEHVLARQVGFATTAPVLRFINLDQFNWNEASLTPRLTQMVRQLAEHVRVSWKSMRPIGYIRLIGHTDNTGPEQYNVDLGDQRARAVKGALEDLLKEDILSGRIRIAVLLEPSPGPAAPTADNRTPESRARNRRVEVFVAPPLPPEPKPPTIPWPPQPPPSVIQTKPGPWWVPIPAGRQGKSLKQWVEGWLSDHHVPKIFWSKIWDAIVGKDFGVLSSLLDAARIGGAAKEAFLATIRTAAETPTR